MKVASYIPIKLNNQRTPGKNLKQFDDGTPLCKFMFDTISKVRGIDERYCFCSDEIIKNYLPANVFFLERSKSLDTSETQCHEIISSFLSKVDADIIVLTHVTCPFIRTETIEKCIDAVKNGGYDSAFSAEKMQDFLWMDGKAINFNPAYAVKTQDLPIVYKESVGCYVFKKEMFLESNRKVGFNPFIVEASKIETIDIDYPEDFELANAVYMRMLKK